MTSPGSGPDATHGADGAPRSGQGRSRRRRRQVHRRSAPPSARTVEQADKKAEQKIQDAPAAVPAEPAVPAASAPSVQDAPGTQDAPVQDGAAQAAPRPARNLPKTFHGSLPSAQEAPFVEITVATSGIHPSTSRMVAFAATLHTADGERAVFSGNRPASAQTDGTDGTENTDPAAQLTGFVQQINPGEDPGPWHLHGYTEADLGQAPGFATVAPLLFDLIEGRTLICHNTTLTWGFIQFEYRRAQRAANRGTQRNNPRGRRRGQRRPKKISVPTPTRIIDTLASARRAGVPVEDPRLRSIASYYTHAHGLDLPQDALASLGPASSLQRADVLADELLLADTRILHPLHLAQREVADGAADNTPGGLSVADPSDLTADRFGLQRSTVRVDATTSPRPFGNPGTPDGHTLRQGMEFVVSPDVGDDPDLLISTATKAGLVYSEKLNRTSSLVVCNRSHELRGKAMHGERKNIPLFTDEEFLAALEDVEPGSTDIAVPDARPATPRIPAPQRGKSRNQGRNRNQSRNRNQARGKNGGRGGNGGGNSGGGNSGNASKDPAKDATSGGGKNNGGGNGGGNGSGRSSSRRRRRRGSGSQKQQGQKQNQKQNQNQG
ncbi:MULTISPECIES: DNA polymerase III subunit epsilon [unclassified Corynebacterium]|uniref:DNA polymerase III subunit epsilon n=1 Tax=unclassified Corynebacterium TaxID=2624378 RepID=UPI003F9283BE